MSVGRDEDVNLISFAVMYFTGEYGEITASQNGYRITAPGYYMTIGA